MEERLQKILAQAGVASRRAAEQLILAGRVEVNGTPVTLLGVKADAERDKIMVDGKRLVREKKIYLLLNKPAGYVTTMADPQGRRMVTELVRAIPERVFPVGRLDYDTEGALIMTNDGAFAYNILHPSKEISRTYEALVAGLPDPAALRRLEEGVELDGVMTWPAQVRILRKDARQTLVELIIHEGRKRQVRRMLQAIGHRVLRLKRTAYGGLRLGRLPSGAYKLLNFMERRRIFS